MTPDKAVTVVARRVAHDVVDDALNGFSTRIAVTEWLHDYLAPHPLLGNDWDDERGCVACSLIVGRILNSEAIRTQYDAGRAEVRAAVEALHRPWYVIDGVRYDHTVPVLNGAPPTDHVCRVTGLDRCADDDHYVLACAECQGSWYEDQPTALFWPCPTIRAIRGEVDP